MIKVEFFGNYRLILGVSEIEIDANTIGQLFEELSRKYASIDRKEITRATLFINDKAIQGVFRNRTKLREGDRVLMMYPSCGG